MNSFKNDCVHVACAADDNYAMPLAVTVLSLLRKLDQSSKLRLYVLDDGISEHSKQRLLKCWRDTRLAVEWLEPDLTLLDGLPVSGHVSRTTYARLLLPSVLPQQVSKVIYLDSDLLVRRDLTAMWNEPFDGALCLSAIDPAAPWLDAEVASPRFKSFQKHLAAVRPIPNYQQLKLDPQANYFNAGVLSIDLAGWRQERIVEQALSCLTKYREQMLWWDQYALNIVLYGRWKSLDMRWNQGGHIYRYPNARECPLEQGMLSNLKSDPWIVHFSSPAKPWHFGCQHPFRRHFLKVVDRSSWRGWRPEKPYRGFAGWMSYEYERYRKWRREFRSRIKQLRTSFRRAA